MRKLISFTHISLDGFFTSEKGDISWAHKPHDDTEWGAFVKENASSGGTLLFGRRTYDIMASYWPSPMASQNDPVVAKNMNECHKIVFSRTLEKADWQNTQLLNGNLVEEARKLKQEAKQDMAILGSGSIVSQLADAGLIDEIQLVIDPLVLGKGKPLFSGLNRRLDLELINSRTFKNSCVVLTYVPAK
jgi:dihydrofolate reductase